MLHQGSPRPFPAIWTVKEAIIQEEHRGQSISKTQYSWTQLLSTLSIKSRQERMVECSRRQGSKSSQQEAISLKLQAQCSLLCRCTRYCTTNCQSISIASSLALSLPTAVQSHLRKPSFWLSSLSKSSKRQLESQAQAFAAALTITTSKRL